MSHRDHTSEQVCKCDSVFKEVASNSHIDTAVSLRSGIKCERKCPLSAALPLWQNQGTAVSVHSTAHEQAHTCFLIPDISGRQKARESEGAKETRRWRDVRSFLCHSSFANAEVKQTQRCVSPPHSCMFALSATTRWTSSLRLTGEWSWRPVRGRTAVIWFHTKCWLFTQDTGNMNYNKAAVTRMQPTPRECENKNVLIWYPFAFWFFSATLEIFLHKLWLTKYHGIPHFSQDSLIP